MSGSRRHRPSAWRIIALCLLALGILAQPVMAAIGEVHELAHAATTHTHDAHDAGTPHQPPPLAGGDVQDGMPDEGGTLLHALMHAGQGCCHAPAIVAGLVIALPAPLADAPPMRVSGPALSHHPADPFRPPIAA